ncbi:MAG: NFACT RNA binding domain-containing protein [Cyanobacteriota bacterium]|nr:NFACT RNA binding domain-containing protein [Cyanobacteriota bacterium]
MASRQPLQPMDVTSLKAVLSEWRLQLVPSRFEKAQQPDPQMIQLGLRSLDGMQWLLLSWQADAARLYRIDPPARSGEGSTLAQQLQHGLRGLALVEIRQPGWERVVELGFARRPDDPIERWLVAELMGRRSNLLLLDGQRQVVTLARQVKDSQSRLRPLTTGDAYTSPPVLQGEPPQQPGSQEVWQRRLMLRSQPLGEALLEAYQGVSPALVRQLLDDEQRQRCVFDLADTTWAGLWQRWSRWLEAVQRDDFGWWQHGAGYRCWQPLPPSASPQTPPADLDRWLINRGAAGYYEGILQRRRLQERRQQLELLLQRGLQQERQQRQEQERLLALTGSSEQLQRQADGLLCQRAPSKACIEEAQRLYRQARKLRRGVEAIQQRLALHHQRLEALEASLVYLTQAEDEVGLDGLAHEIEAWHRRARRRTGASAPARDRHLPHPLELRTPGGLTVQVGRNHRQNEWISLRQARRGDLWFHAQELPGSHVVLKCSVAPAADGDQQLAADLAAHFSRGRGNRKVPVVMVPTHDLQRIPGAAPGTVRHRGGTLLWGEPERALAALAAAPSLRPSPQP